MLSYVAIDRYSPLHSYQDPLIITSTLCLILSNLLAFGINQYTQRKDYEYTKMELLLQKETDSIEFYKILLAQNENQSILIHDIKRHLQSVASLNEQGETEKINRYIQNLLNSSSLKASAKKCDHPLLNVILSRYDHICNEADISFHCDIRKKTTQFIQDADLTALFCNLLDNAYEAAKDIPVSFIDVLVNRSSPAVTMIRIVNSCKSNPFSPDGEKLISRKPNKKHHGFGIKSIRKVVKKYSGEFQCYYSDETHCFHTIATLQQEDKL